MSVTVESGVNSTTADLAGKTVGDIRAMLRQPLNLDPWATVIINGETHAPDYIAQDGDVIEFVKKSGQKGNRR